MYLHGMQLINCRIAGTNTQLEPIASCSRQEPAMSVSPLPKRYKDGSAVAAAPEPAFTAERTLAAFEPEEVRWPT
jgi:hypothetical protein